MCPFPGMSMLTLFGLKVLRIFLAYFFERWNQAVCSFLFLGTNEPIWVAGHVFMLI